MATERKVKEQEVQIARYRILKQEVTDPLAAGLLHLIISELEADVRADECQKAAVSAWTAFLKYAITTSVTGLHPSCRCQHLRRPAQLIVFQDGAHLIDWPLLPHRQHSDTTVIIAANQRMRTGRIVNGDELLAPCRAANSKLRQDRPEKFAISSRRQVRQDDFRNVL
jgi:hypothetical protein